MILQLVILEMNDPLMLFRISGFLPECGENIEGYYESSGDKSWQ